MKNVTEYVNCCGCGQCVIVCSLKAIKMKQNKQGFYYPFVDDKKCVQCGKCIQACNYNLLLFDGKQSSVKESYAVKHKDESVRALSRSGGIFTSISDWILENGGVVYGCKLVNCRSAIHTRATTKIERDMFRGSKYIQSKIFDCFELVKNDLQNDLWVLFSGTPCQVNAINAFCHNINTEKLLLIDIVCHGVPSSMVWEDYIDFVSKNKKIVSVEFRDKNRFGWADHKETFKFDNGSIYSSDVFKELFYDHLVIREDCFECPFKHLNRVGDITIADCWGIAENYPDFDDNKGVSLVLLNSIKGKNVWRQLKNIDSINVDLSKLMQPPLFRNWEKPSNYNAFWKYYNIHSFKKVINKYVYKTPSLKKRVINRLKRMTVQALRKE